MVEKYPHRITKKGKRINDEYLVLVKSMLRAEISVNMLEVDDDNTKHWETGHWPFLGSGKIIIYNKDKI